MKSKQRSKQDHNAKTQKKQIKINSLRSLKKIRTNVAGIDVGAEHHYVALPDPKHDGKIVVYRFGTFTANLKECVDLLKQCKIESVVMEATGVYWTILYDMIQMEGIEVILVNPRDFKKMKDKKTDVTDSEYLQLYHSYGLFEGAIVPVQNIRELRTFTRLRDQSVEDAATSIQRMQKSLVNMNLRLENVLEDISGVTGMNIIRAIIAGERDPKKLSQYRDPRCKKTQEEIEDSLQGFYQDDHLFALQRALGQYDFHILEIKKVDEKIASKLNEFGTHANYHPESTHDAVQKTKLKENKQQKRHKYAFDLTKELVRITGVDLTLLAGIGPHTALMMISETGLDMTRWQSAKHFTSWLGLAPNNKVSGGKILNNRTKKKKKKAAILLRMAASSLYSEANDTALGAFFRRKRAHIGPPKAVTAAANKLGRMYYMTLLTGKQFEEPGADAYYEQQKEKYLRNVQRRISGWGYKLTPIANPNQNVKEEAISETVVA